MRSQLHTVVILPLGKGYDTQWLLGWVSPTASLSNVDKRKRVSMSGMKPQFHHLILQRKTAKNL
jgi:hypothetical protein